MINVKNLYHSYTNDENYAVEDISFEIGKGEIFGFLGWDCHSVPVFGDA